MNLVSRKMVIKELKDRFLVRRKYGSGQFGEAVFAVESGLCGGIMRIFTLAAFGQLWGPLQVIWSSGSISMSTRSVHSTSPTSSSLPGTRRLNYCKQQVFLLRDF